MIFIALIAYMLKNLFIKFTFTLYSNIKDLMSINMRIKFNIQSVFCKINLLHHFVSKTVDFQHFSSYVVN